MTKPEQLTQCWLYEILNRWNQLFAKVFLKKDQKKQTISSIEEISPEELQALAERRRVAHERAIEELRILETKQFLMGLTPTSSIEQIKDQLVSFAMTANDKAMKNLYDWAVSIHGRETMVPILFNVTVRSAVAAKMTQFLFKEMAAVKPISPVMIANWIDLHFYEISNADLEFLLHFNDAASTVYPSTFMYLVVSRCYEKALMLFEMGCRINTRCRPIKLDIAVMDSCDSQYIRLEFEPRQSELDRRAGDVFIEFLKRLPDYDIHIQRRLASLRFNSATNHFRKPKN